MPCQHREVAIMNATVLKEMITMWGDLFYARPRKVSEKFLEEFAVLIGYAWRTLK
jgi:hypothetical protein